MSKIIQLTNENFDTEVSNASGAVLVDFGAEWCGPCKKMEPIIESMADEFSGKAKIGKVDVGVSQEIAAKFGIMSVPTILVFKDGKLMEQSSGYMPKDKLESLLKKHI